MHQTQAPFVSPVQRLQLQFELCESQSVSSAHKQRLQRDKVEAIKEQRAREAVIGSGCECGKTQYCLELFECINVHFQGVEGLSKCVMDFLPPGSTPLPVLTPEQKYVIALVACGKNVFFTGKAGTGKSFVLKSLRLAKQKGVFFTSTTGISALQLQGKTIHAFSGCGIDGDDPNPQKVLQRIKSNSKTVTRWKRCKCLVLDEASMLSSVMFQNLDFVARVLRDNPHRPFGGIQVVFSGDFCQLAPIKGGYCFDTLLWHEVFEKENCVELTRVFRQQDSVFLNILNEARLGNMSQASLTWLQQLSRPLCTHNGILPTQLFARLNEVRGFNSDCFSRLSGPIETYKSDDQFTDQYAMDQLKKTCPAQQYLHLRKDAQVMLLRNMKFRVVRYHAKGRASTHEIYLGNGQKGIVTDLSRDGATVRFENCEDLVFVHPEVWEIRRKRVHPTNDDEEENELCVQEDAGEEQHGKYEVVASRRQIPLQLAWATTIHKSQGQTLSKMRVKLSDMFAPGQAYVALSRAKSLRELEITGSVSQPKTFYQSDKCKNFMQSLLPCPLFATTTKEEIEMVWYWDSPTMRDCLGIESKKAASSSFRKRKRRVEEHVF